MMMKIKNKILSSLPVSRRAFNTEIRFFTTMCTEQNKNIIKILDAHKEFQLINRQDIMMIAKEMAVKTSKAQKPKEPEKKKPNKKDVMYG